MRIPPPTPPIGPRGPKKQYEQLIGAYKFKKSQGANSAAMRNREDSNGNSGFGATSPRATKPRGMTRKKMRSGAGYGMGIIKNRKFGK